MHAYAWLFMYKFEIFMDVVVIYLLCVQELSDWSISQAPVTNGSKAMAELPNALQYLFEQVCMIYSDRAVRVRQRRQTVAILPVGTNRGLV